MHIFSELLRRRVLQAAVIYAAAAWGAVEILSFLLQRLHAPDTMLTWLAVLFVAGFPVAMLGAWFFDFRSGGLTRVAPAMPVDRLSGAVALALLLGAATLLAWLMLSAPGYPGGYAEPAALPGSSVAVLPFENLSADESSEFFSDGLSDTLIDRLANMPGLLVIARTSSFAFKDTATDVREIGRALGVAALVEGSVQRSGERLKIIAQLVSTQDGTHMWSRTYERTLDDVFAIQDEIAARIADALGEKLRSPSGRVQSPASIEALDLYLLGRHHLYRRTEADLRRASALFEQAAARDPAFAPAYSGLADAQLLLLDYANESWGAILPAAEQAVRTALRLDPELAEAHASRGLLHKTRSEFEQAEMAFRRAIALNDNYAPAYLWLAITLDDQGRYDDAVQLHQKARQLDPLSFQVLNRMALNYWLRGDLDNARQTFRQAVEIEPGHGNGYWGLALTDWSGGLVDSAARWFGEALERDPHRVFFLAQLGSVYLDSGEAAAALERIDTAWELAPHFAWTAYLKGVAYVAAGRRPEAEAFARSLATAHPEDAYMLSAAGSILTIAGAAGQAQGIFASVESLLEADQVLAGSWDVIFARCFDAYRALAMAAAGDQAGSEALAARLRDQVLTLQARGLGLVQSSYCLAQAHALSGNRPEAFQALEHAFSGGWPRCWFLTFDPVFSSSRGTPELRRLTTACPAREQTGGRAVGSSTSRPSSLLPGEDVSVSACARMPLPEWSWRALWRSAGRHDSMHIPGTPESSTERTGHV